MIARMGSALILIGTVLMVIFLVTSSAGQGDFLMLLAGAGVSAIGLLLRRGRGSQAPQTGRFHTLRRLMGEEVQDEPESDEE